MPPAKSFAPRAFAGAWSIDADIVRGPYRAFAAKGTGERADAIPIERPSPEFREGRWPPCLSSIRSASAPEQGARGTLASTTSSVQHRKCTTPQRTPSTSRDTPRYGPHAELVAAMNRPQRSLPARWEVETACGKWPRGVRWPRPARCHFDLLLTSAPAGHLLSTQSPS